MTAYVDNARNRLGRMITCHLIADTEAEMHAMAVKIGCKREWLHRDHYDLSLTRKADAIRYGAVEVTTREMARIRRRLRTAKASRGLSAIMRQIAEGAPPAPLASNRLTETVD